jgi:hypothetical protein
MFVMRVVKRFTAVMCALFGGTYREQNSWHSNVSDLADSVPFPKLRLGTSFILQTTRSRFCLHGNQGGFACIHVSLLGLLSLQL